MITNKQVFEQGKLVQHYPIDHNPFTGEQESNGGVENLVIFDHKVYSVLTDFTGSIADASGEPSLVTDDAEGFMNTMFIFDDPEEVLKAETEAQEEVDYDEWERWESAHGIQEIDDDWMRQEDW
jgi:hypothetical protein